ncbi:hypothetical protein N9I30_00655 [Flavobacteriales bacterium]|nr:hypothetical protein [Flavobacteriales bacterium]
MEYVISCLPLLCSEGGKPDPCDCTILYMSRAYSEVKELWDDCKYYYNNTAKVELEFGKQEGRFKSN